MMKLIRNILFVNDHLGGLVGSECSDLRKPLRADPFIRGPAAVDQPLPSRLSLANLHASELGLAKWT